MTRMDGGNVVSTAGVSLAQEITVSKPEKDGAGKEWQAGKRDGYLNEPQPLCFTGSRATRGL